MIQQAARQRVCTALLKCAYGASSDAASLQAVQVARFQHSDSRPSRAQLNPQSVSADPFTANLQSKTEQELLDQVLRQAQQEELAEEAAEEVTAGCFCSAGLLDIKHTLLSARSDSVETSYIP